MSFIGKAVRLFTAGARARVAGTVMALVAAQLIITHALGAQQTDVIRGRVTSVTGGNPVEGALITATTLSGAVSRTGRADRNGRYTITFPNGEGDYWITINAIGFVPRRFELKRTADQDILVADVRMTPSSSVLDTVTSIGRRDRPLRRDSLIDIGGLDRGVNTANVSIEQLGNLAIMAASTPGLLFIPGVDGDPAGYSAFGLDPSQNGTTLNGLNSAATDLPRDGEYGVGIALSPYDVSQGQFSGARTNVRIGSGTNFVRRLSSVLLNTPPLEWTDNTGRALSQEYSNLNIGGGASGPLALNTSFYNLSYQFGRVANDLRTLLNADPLGLQTAGIASDSVTRLLNILDDAGIPASVRAVPGSRQSDQALVLGAFDFAPSSTAGHALRVAFNAGWTRTAPASLLPTSIPSSGFNNTNWNAGVQAHHSAYFGFGLLTETSVSLSGSQRYTTPYLTLPAGHVTVRSEFDDGSNSIQSIAFGGATSDTRTTTSSLEVLNQLSWFTANNHHRLKLTTDVRADALDGRQSQNAFGTFTFRTLEDLESRHPSSFTRQLTPRSTHSTALLGGVALGDSYLVSDDLQLQFGVRLDGNRFGDAPARNVAIEQTFGVRNDRVPNRIYASPRIGFSWTFRSAPEVGAFAGAARVPALVVRGGAGVFQGAPGTGLPLQAITNTGLPGGVQQLTCAGAATPVPDWSLFATNSDAVPSLCADGSAGTVFSSTAPNVTLFDKRFAAPRSIRANLQASRTILDNRVRTTLGGIYSLNQHQPGFTDLNFSGIGRFTIDDESARPVFVDAPSIDATSGVIALRDGRISPAFNRVTALTSNFTSNARQFQILISPVAASTRYTWGASYTNNRVRDRLSGFMNTGGSPFTASKARSALDWRHQLQLSVGYNLFDVIRLQWFHSFVSGVPYTPMVAGDINGDGQPTNDRAFVFDPAVTPDPSLAASMRSLLTTGPAHVRDCLSHQLGRISARSSCEAPWTSTASMRIDFNPVRVRMPQRTMLSLSITNPLAGLDLLLHGTNHTHGWGQFRAPDDRLLFVRGFDPATQRFNYDVNPRFGNTSPRTSAVRSPVAVTAMVRIDLGPSRERQELTRRLDRGRTEPGDKATAAELRAAYSSAGILNPMAIMLRAADSLKLTGEQADSLATLNRWFTIRLDSIWSPVVRSYAALPARYSHGEAYWQYVRARERSVDLLIRIAPSINTLLTSAQKRKLPALTASYLDLRYLAAVRSRTPGLSAPVFPPPAGTPGETGGRARGGGP